MSDADMEFGDLDHPEPERQLRPDQNKQYAAVTCGRINEQDLAVFVDIDALRDMELHALSDTRVELGGVLLGGQYEDEQGRPFVVVSDSLRARHYESTRGSFKFTHDTWEEITRERDDFPADLQMVGWYHTHPDWGVFLSGMDMFICDNFFNRPLDVALVIDPCRGDRGWFQWTGRTEERVRRTGGFFLFGSRHRRWELEGFAAQLEGKSMMLNDPRTSGYPAASGAYPSPVIHLADSRTAWPIIATLALAGMQFLLVTVLIWRLLLPPAAVAEADGSRAVDELAAQVQTLTEGQSAQQELESQREMLDRVVAQLSDGSAAGLVRLVEQQRQELQQLAADARVYRGMEQRVKLDNEALTAQLEAAHGRELTAGEQLASLRQKLIKETAAHRESQDQVQALEKQLRGEGVDVGDTDSWLDWQRFPPWAWGLGGLLLGVAATLGCFAFRPRPEDQAEWGESEPSSEKLEIDGKDEPPEANNESSK